MALWLIEKETYKLQNPRSFRKKGIFFRETVIKISFQFFFHGLVQPIHETSEL